VEKVFWVILGGAAFAAALPAVNNPRALLAGRIALGALYIGAGALVNAIYHLTRSERLFFRPGKSSSATCPRPTAGPAAHQPSKR
jgi:hypothetical protein